eukprot:IDg7269t1
MATRLISSQGACASTDTDTRARAALRECVRGSMARSGLSRSPRHVGGLSALELLSDVACDIASLHRQTSPASSAITPERSSSPETSPWARGARGRAVETVLFTPPGRDVGRAGRGAARIAPARVIRKLTSHAAAGTGWKNRGARWECTHCRAACPRRAQCAIYRRTNERRREQQQRGRARRDCPMSITHSHPPPPDPRMLRVLSAPVRVLPLPLPLTSLYARASSRTPSVHFRHGAVGHD